MTNPFDEDDKLLLQIADNVWIHFDTRRQKIAYIKKQCIEVHKKLKYWQKILAKAEVQNGKI